MSNTWHTRPVPKADYPALRKPERLHVGTLQTRMEYLRKRLAEGDHSRSAGPFLAGEASALAWALEQLDEIYNADSAQNENVIAKLEQLCENNKDGERMHSDADKILLEAVSPEVRAAYEAVVKCAPWWAAA